MKNKKKTVQEHRNLSAAGVLGHGLGTLADCVLGQLSGEVEAHGRLDFPAGDGVLLVVVGQAGGLGRDTLEDVVHERVHDAHGLARDAGIGVDLLQDLVDVNGVALLARLPPLLLALADRLLDGGGFLLALLGCCDLARHGG